MYTVAIVEDDAAHAAELARMIAASPAAEHLELAAAWRAVDNIQRTPSDNASPCPLDTDSHRVLSAAALPDILFVDVRLADGLNGIDLVHRLIPSTAPVQVIYVSAYLEYAPAAYHTRHTWFLSKPVVQDELNAALARAAHGAGALLIEDCAHCVGRMATDSSDIPLADVSVHSFGVEKMLRTSFGGAICASRRNETPRPLSLCNT